MSGIVNESLRKAAKGTAIAFVGMLVYMLLEFITRVIIARNTTQSDYGIFSIGFVLMNFFVIASCLGLTGGAARYIAYFRGKGESNKVKGVIFHGAIFGYRKSVLLCALFLFR